MNLSATPWNMIIRSVTVYQMKLMPLSLLTCLRTVYVPLISLCFANIIFLPVRQYDLMPTLALLHILRESDRTFWQNN